MADLCRPLPPTAIAMTSRSGIALLLVLGALPSAGADIYKWTDEHGRTHYGDHPQVAGATELSVDGSEAPDLGRQQRAARQARLLKAWAEERAERRAQDAAEREAREARAQRCRQARETLGEYQQAAYIYDVDTQGQRRILTDAEHADAMDEARAAVAHWCGPETPGTRQANR